MKPCCQCHKRSGAAINPVTTEAVLSQERRCCHQPRGGAVINPVTREAMLSQERRCCHKRSGAVTREAMLSKERRCCHQPCHKRSDAVTREAVLSQERQCCHKRGGAVTREAVLSQESHKRGGAVTREAVLLHERRCCHKRGDAVTREEVLSKEKRCCYQESHKSKVTRHKSRVGQNRIYTPYITVYLMERLLKIPYIHRIYMVLANPTRESHKRVTRKAVLLSTLTALCCFQP